MDDRTRDFATVDDKTYPLSKQKYPPFNRKKPDGISYPFDELTQSAIEFIDDSQQGQKPFFRNLCHWMVHWPVLTRNGELLEHYCDKFGISVSVFSLRFRIIGRDRQRTSCL